MAAKRFSTYLSESESTELDLMRVELGLTTKGAQAKQDAELLSVMKSVTQKVMEDIRGRKRREIRENPDKASESPIATWKDVCDEIGFPRESFERILERDPRKPRKSSTSSTSGAMIGKDEGISETGGETPDQGDQPEIETGSG